MYRRVCLLALVLVLQGCGTRPFNPQIYPLRDGLIPALDIAGTTSVTNDQPSKSEAIVYSYGGNQLASNLNAITEVMVQQTKNELAKNGKVSAAGKPKTISLKVNSLLSTYFIMSWKSKLQFEAQLGDGTVVTRDVNHASGSLGQDLNGCIAEAVMELLKDPRVRAYLAQQG